MLSFLALTELVVPRDGKVILQAVGARGLRDARVLADVERGGHGRGLLEAVILADDISSHKGRERDQRQRESRDKIRSSSDFEALPANNCGRPLILQLFSLESLSTPSSSPSWTTTRCERRSERVPTSDLDDTVTFAAGYSLSVHDLSECQRE